MLGQEAHRFQGEVDKMTSSDQPVNKKDLMLFTGSSTIRMWKSLAADFPDKNVLNRGFGGSQMDDLIYFADKLVVAYNPKKVFIYEGDNDLAANKSSEQILEQASKLLSIIREKLPAKTKVYFISAKPSLSRWSLKDKYLDFNSKLKAWTATQKNVEFIDMWAPMLGADGTVMKDIFIEDGLHMNAKGYAIWAKHFKRYL